MKTYVFGYGSLIWPEGIHGRGMSHIYEDAELIPARLKGYKRDWNAVSTSGERYLGITKDKDSFVDGYVFEIHSDADLAALSRSEEVGRTYDLTDITKDVLVALPSDAKILTCVTKNPSYKGEVSGYYLSHIKQALATKPEAFRKNFSFKNSGSRQMA